MNTIRFTKNTGQFHSKFRWVALIEDNSDHKWSYGVAVFPVGGNFYIDPDIGWNPDAEDDDSAQSHLPAAQIEASLAAKHENGAGAALCSPSSICVEEGTALAALLNLTDGIWTDGEVDATYN